ncbi:hypothetical protein DL96DRAFT_1587544 [Flagelloscypha sp. PMI_526]|nr:hypothetical protein DL96DRAFT_1587544 [Flagelloscypha sp. PMI_526]
MSAPHIRKKRSHTKSKLGCLTCKKRRVKCDQTNFPNCKNCSNRKIECDWPPLYAPLNEDENSLKSGPIMQPSFTQGLEGDDLELLHHFTTSTVLSLTDISGIEFPEVLEIYQRQAPRLGLAHPALMHSILSFSALHLYWLNRNGTSSVADWYYSLSCYHRAQAVQTFDPTPCTNPQCGPSCSCGQRTTAQFLTNIILSLHAVCESMIKLPTSVHPHMRVMHWLLNGKRDLERFYCTEDGHVLVGPSSPASSQGQGPSVYFPTTPTTASSSTLPISLSPILFSLHLPYSGAPDDAELLWPTPLDTAQIYADMVHGLHVSYRLFFERHAPMRVIYMWSSQLMPEDGLTFISQRRPRALIILAHIIALHRWCNLAGATWWESESQSSLDLIRDMLPNDAWKAYFDASFTSV